MEDKPKLSRQAMCDRLAMEFQDEWMVNLGVGMPTLCSNYVDPSKEIIFHSENGVIGYGPLAEEGKEDRHLVNASGQHVTVQPGMAIVHHADSFGLIRSGRLDVCVMGAYEVAENGDFANWRLPPAEGRRHRRGHGPGGLRQAGLHRHGTHYPQRARPRLRKRCELPITAPGVVTMVATNLGLFQVGPNGFTLLEHAPGWSPEEIQELTEAELTIPDDLKEFRLRE